MKFVLFMFLSFLSLNCHARGKSHSLKDIHSVGDVKISLLNNEQFTREHGDCWKIMDGDDGSQTKVIVSGSSFSRLTGFDRVPDARGRFLRMHNNGTRVNPDGTRLGGLQEDDLKSHDHKIAQNQVTMREFLAQKGFDYGVLVRNPVELQTEKVGGSETRPKSVTVNYFVKVETGQRLGISCL